MKNGLIFLILFSVLFTTATAQVEPLNSPALVEKLALQRRMDTSFYGTPFANFRIISPTGKTYSNADLLGKACVLHFWFTACVPCQQEMPDVNALYLRFKENPNFEFIGITFDDTATIKNSIAQYHIQFPVVSVSESELKKFFYIYGKGFPSTFLVGKDGHIQLVSNSLVNDPKFEKRLIPAIEKILAKQ